MKRRPAGCPELWFVLRRADTERRVESVMATPHQIDMSINQYTGTTRAFSNQSLVIVAGQVKREWECEVGSQASVASPG